MSKGVAAEQRASEFSIEEIKKGVFLHKSFKLVHDFGLVRSNGLVVVDNGEAFIVDTPWSDDDTLVLIQWIKDKGFTLKGSISTHSHEDRTAGIGLLNKNGVPTYVSDQTNEILKSQNKPQASNGFSGDSFTLKNGLIEAYYPGGGHTVDNIVVWLPKSKVLFGGCFVRSLKSLSLGYVGEAKVKAWSSSVDKVIDRYPDAKLVVPGHGTMGDGALLQHTKKLADSALKN